MLFLLILLTLGLTLRGQKNAKVESAAFSDKINSLIKFSVPVISVTDAHALKDVKYLDAREPKEYNVSHLPGAKYVGYDYFSENLVKDIDRNKTIVVYCSIGYRSEKIGEKLSKLGFKKVYNLYGSIFEWANQGYPLTDFEGKPTNKIHVYNKKWSKWMVNPKYEKVF